MEKPVVDPVSYIRSRRTGMLIPVYDEDETFVGNYLPTREIAAKAVETQSAQPVSANAPVAGLHATPDKLPSISAQAESKSGTAPPNTEKVSSRSAERSTSQSAAALPSLLDNGKRVFPVRNLQLKYRKDDEGERAAVKEAPQPSTTVAETEKSSQPHVKWTKEVFASVAAEFGKPQKTTPLEIDLVLQHLNKTFPEIAWNLGTARVRLTQQGYKVSVEPSANDTCAKTEKVSSSSSGRSSRVGTKNPVAADKEQNISTEKSVPVKDKQSDDSWRLLVKPLYAGKKQQTDKPIAADNIETSTPEKLGRGRRRRRNNSSDGDETEANKSKDEVIISAVSDNTADDTTEHRASKRRHAVENVYTSDSTEKRRVGRPFKNPRENEFQSTLADAEASSTIVNDKSEAKLLTRIPISGDKLAFIRKILNGADPPKYIGDLLPLIQECYPRFEPDVKAFRFKLVELGYKLKPGYAARRESRSTAASIVADNDAGAENTENDQHNQKRFSKHVIDRIRKIMAQNGAPTHIQNLLSKLRTQFPTENLPGPRSARAQLHDLGYDLSKGYDRTDENLADEGEAADKIDIKQVERNVTSTASPVVRDSRFSSEMERFIRTYFETHLPRDTYNVELFELLKLKFNYSCASETSATRAIRTMGYEVRFCPNNKRKEFLMHFRNKLDQQEKQQQQLQEAGSTNKVARQPNGTRSDKRRLSNKNDAGATNSRREERVVTPIKISRNVVAESGGDATSKRRIRASIDDAGSQASTVSSVDTVAPSKEAFLQSANTRRSLKQQRDETAAESNQPSPGCSLKPPPSLRHPFVDSSVIRTSVAAQEVLNAPELLKRRNLATKHVARRPPFAVDRSVAPDPPASIREIDRSLTPSPVPSMNAKSDATLTTKTRVHITRQKDNSLLARHASNFLARARGIRANRAAGGRFSTRSRAPGTKQTISLSAASSSAALNTDADSNSAVSKKAAVIMPSLRLKRLNQSMTAQVKTKSPRVIVVRGNDAEHKALLPEKASNAKHLTRDAEQMTTKHAESSSTSQNDSAADSDEGIEVVDVVRKPRNKLNRISFLGGGATASTADLPLKDKPTTGDASIDIKPDFSTLSSGMMPVKKEEEVDALWEALETNYRQSDPATNDTKSKPTQSADPSSQKGSRPRSSPALKLDVIMWRRNIAREVDIMHKGWKFDRGNCVQLSSVLPSSLAKEMQKVAEIAAKLRAEHKLGYQPYTVLNFASRMLGVDLRKPSEISKCKPDYGDQRKLLDGSVHEPVYANVWSEALSKEEVNLLLIGKPVEKVELPLIVGDSLPVDDLASCTATTADEDDDVIFVSTTDVSKNIALDSPSEKEVEAEPTSGDARAETNAASSAAGCAFVAEHSSPTSPISALINQRSPHENSSDKMEDASVMSIIEVMVNSIVEQLNSSDLDAKLLQSSTSDALQAE